MVCTYIRKAAEWPSSNEISKNRCPLFSSSHWFSALALSQNTSDMPRVSYENQRQTFILNTALNHEVQELDSAPPLTTMFALNDATRQPRRRAETLPWSHQMSILKLGSQRNSLQLKPFPKSIPIPHFVQSEHDGDVKMGRQDGMGHERGHDYYHTTYLNFFSCNFNVFIIIDYYFFSSKYEFAWGS